MLLKSVQNHCSSTVNFPFEYWTKLKIPSKIKRSVCFLLLLPCYWALKLREKGTCCISNLFPHGPRNPNEAYFHWNPERLGMGRQIGQINSGAFGVFSAELSAPILVQLHESIIQQLFLQKTKPSLYPHPKYFFGIRIWIWAAKNKGFSLRVSVVRVS